MFLIFPETSNRTLEELTFRESSLLTVVIRGWHGTYGSRVTVFEGAEMQDKVDAQVEKEMVTHEHREVGTEKSQAA